MKRKTIFCDVFIVISAANAVFTQNSEDLLNLIFPSNSI